MISGLYILDLKGKVLISRQYRGDLLPGAPEKFMNLLQESQDPTSVSPTYQSFSSRLDPAYSPPILTHDGYHYLYIRHSDIYLLAITTNLSADPVMIFLFLHKLVHIFKDYFKELEEESIKDNFVIIYELLDEVMDFGYPQFTDASLLRDYIIQEGHKLNRLGSKLTQKPPLGVTGSVAWRSEGLAYKKNEVFLDVIEKINLFLNADGAIMESEILGAVLMRCDLSGMPELRLGLNDKLSSLGNAAGEYESGMEMEDVKFHQCVRLDDFMADRTISFIPPDGSFELMTYRLPSPGGYSGASSGSPQSSPLLLFIPTISLNVYSGTRVEIDLTLRANVHPSNPLYSAKKRSNSASTIIVNEIRLEIPIEEDGMNFKFKNPRKIGKISYKPEGNVIEWRIKRIPLFFTRDLAIKVEYNIPSIRSVYSGARVTPALPGSSPQAAAHAAQLGVPSTLGVLKLAFDIPYFSVSGLQVKYLKIIEKSGYQALPWVRYITQNGQYQMRLPPPTMH